MVRQPRQELTDQAVLAGVHLDAGEAGLGGRCRSGGEAFNDGADIVGFHPLRDLAAGDLGDAGRRPQRPLRVRRRALAPGVADRSEHESAPLLTHAAELAPAIEAAGGQWRPLVRPVALVDARLLQYDDPATTVGPALVVRGVAIGEATVDVAEVGDMGTEQQSVAGGASPEPDRLEQSHQPM